jgi:hypothetical protein
MTKASPDKYPVRIASLIASHNGNELRPLKIIKIRPPISIGMPISGRSCGMRNKNMNDVKNAQRPAIKRNMLSIFVPRFLSH